MHWNVLCATEQKNVVIQLKKTSKNGEKSGRRAGNTEEEGIKGKDCVSSGLRPTVLSGSTPSLRGL